MAIAVAAAGALFTGGTSALLGFAINTGASIGFNLLSNWISPKKSPKIAEETPSLGVGADLYACWGETFCPTTIWYTIPQEKTSHDDSRSTYGVMGCINPDSTGSLIGLRINNYMVASGSPLFLLQVPSNALSPSKAPIPNTGKNGFPNLTGYSDNGGISYQWNTVAPNSFGLLGFTNLKYRGWNWTEVNAVKRNLFGGNNVRLTQYVANRLTSSSPAPYDVRFNNPVNISIRVGVNGKVLGIGGSSYVVTYTFPDGVHKVRQMRLFETPNVASRWLMGAGNGSNHAVLINAPVVDSIGFSLAGPIIPGGVITTVGLYSELPEASASTPISSNHILIAKTGSPVIKQPLSSSFTAPFYSLNGQVYDYATNTNIASIPPGYSVVGWADRLFFIGGDFFVSGSTWTDPLPYFGTTTVSKTDLETIVSDLYKVRYPDQILINDDAPSTTPLRGFTSNYDDVGQTIVNLATAYGKFLYEDGDGNLHMRRYPDIPVFAPTNPNVKPPVRFALEDFVDQPKVEFTPLDQLPSSLEFFYRSYSNEFSEKSVKVGGGSADNTTTNTRLNVVATATEARKLAWTTYYLQTLTNTSLQFRTRKLYRVRKGDVIQLDIRPDTEFAPTRPKIPNYWIVGDIELGRDRTFLLTCVNWVPLYDLLSNNNFDSYMLGSDTPSSEAAGGGGGINSVSPSTKIRMVEAVDSSFANSSWAGSLLYTDRNYPYMTGPAPNGTPVQFSKPTSINNCFSGAVSQLVWLHDDPRYGLDRIQVTAQPGTSGVLVTGTEVLLRVGLTWLRGTVTAGTLPGVYDFYSNAYNSTAQLSGGSITGARLDIGLYGSAPEVFLGEPVEFLATDQVVYGYSEQLSSINLPVVTWNNTLSQTRYSYQDLTSTGEYGQPSSRFPYGNPVPGSSMATAVVHYAAGFLTMFHSWPGNRNVTDPFWDNTSPSYFYQHEFYISINSGPFTFLGGVSPAFNNMTQTSYPVAMLPGDSFEIVRRATFLFNHPAGSYIFKGTVI